jgi:hypothetical protein
MECFQQPNSGTTISNRGKLIWLNSTNFYSYLTLTGNYIADNPLILPSQFILVLSNAVIIPLANFTVAASPTMTAKGNAIIVINGQHYSGVVAPGGPSTGIINCSSISTPFIFLINYHSSYKFVFIVGF